MIKLVNRKSRWFAIISLLLVIVLASVGTVSAAEFPKGETIPVGETINDDVFISGVNVVIDGVINGNLFASGQTVTLNGNVSGDALLMAETVIVNEGAIVDGNLFLAGADLMVNGRVSGSVFGGSASMKVGQQAITDRNLYYGGFSFQTNTGSSVGKDLYVGAYQAMISGAIDRDLAVGAAAVELNGSVGRNARIEVGQVEQADESNAWMQFNPYMSKYVSRTISPGIRVSENASIAGNLTYTSSIQQIEQLDQTVSGTVVYQTPSPQEMGSYSGEVRPFRRGFPAGFLFGATLIKISRNFMKLMVLGALILWLLYKPFNKLVDAAYADPLKAMGWGFVIIAVGFMALLIVPLVFLMVGVIIGFLSLGSLLYVWFGIAGAVLMLAFMLFFFSVFTLSKIIAAYMFGQWMMKVLFKLEKENIWLNLLVGVLLFVVIRSLPLVGWLGGMAATLIGTGAFWLALMQKKAS